MPIEGGSVAPGERLATVRKDILPFYRVLGLTPGAGPNEIRRAYRQLVQQWHPDLFKPGSPMQTTAEDMTKEINEAYDQLHRRKLYRQYPPPGEARAPAEGEGGVDLRPSRRSRSARAKPPQPAPEAAKPRGGRWVRIRAGARRLVHRRGVRWAAALVTLASVGWAAWSWWPDHPFWEERAATPPAPDAPAVPIAAAVPSAAPTGVSASKSIAAAATPTPTSVAFAVVRSAPTPPAGHQWPAAGSLLSLDPPAPDQGNRDDPIASETGDKLAGVDKLFVELFEPGDSKARVRAIQGPPDEEGNSVLRYGSSLVYFYEGRVRGWVDREPRLRVRWWDDTTRPSLERFETGSSRAEVVRAQGQPNAYSIDRYLYGTSEVRFSGGRVTGWITGDVPLHAFDLPALPLERSDPGRLIQP